jgi:hypothetical protein
MANPNSPLNGQGDEIDPIVQPDGTPRLKAAGVTVTISGSDDDGATQLTTDFTMLTGHGGQVVAAGPVRTKLLASATPCRRITVKALVSNSDTLYLGLSAVTANANNTTGGFQLSPGEAFTFGIDDVSKVYIHGTAGEGATFAYEL